MLQWCCSLAGARRLMKLPQLVELGPLAPALKNQSFGALEDLVLDLSGCEPWRRNEP